MFEVILYIAKKVWYACMHARTVCIISALQSLQATQDANVPEWHTFQGPYTGIK